MTNKSIGNFLAELRKEKGLTQKEVADFLNVSDKTVSHWECDKYSPDISVIPILAEFFGVTCDEILKGEKITPIYNENNFSFEPLTKENEYEKYAKIRLKNAYNKLKTSNVISVFCSAFVLAFLIIIIFIIDGYVPFELGVTVSAGFSACLGVLISYLAYNKFISTLNLCNLPSDEHKHWKKKSALVCIFPVIYAFLVFAFIMLILLPTTRIDYSYTETMSVPVSVEPDESADNIADPSLPITSEVNIFTD
ncbi:MAG: helix-turn-helix transcriptional regulator [Clostridia bacterium]|nr:helix-turn-helix transcriptional regulator [Clostridia bacterium]